MAGMSQRGAQRPRWTVYVALAVMLAAIFAYVASLDEADPVALPQAEEVLGEGP